MEIFVNLSVMGAPVGVGIVVLGVLLMAFLRGLMSPLAAVPGPWYSKFTGAVLKWNTVGGRRLHYIHEMHQKYGSLVRIGPTEVDVSELEAFNEIHKIGGGFLKDPWYQRFRSGTSSDVFSVIDPKDHAAKRRLLARPFSNSSLRQNWEKAVVEEVRLTVARIKAEAQQGSADVMKWWTFMTTDVISLLSFGESFGMVKAGKQTPFVNDLDVVTKLSGMRAEFTGLYEFVKFMSFGLFRRFEAADGRIMEYSKKVVTNARDRSLDKSNIFAGVLEQSEKEGTPISESYAVFEAAGLIVAGSGTTAMTLTYLVWAVLQNRQVQAKLEEEVAALNQDFTDTDLETLPYMAAVIQETLRLYGAAPGSLPRKVPKSGLTVNDTFIPEGTTVCTQAYTIHRDPAIFESPESFYPERFLDMPQKQKSALSAFGAGSRTCLGVHLAHMELRHGVAQFFRECAGAKLASSTTPASMEILHYFLISPKGGKCEITLKQSVRSQIYGRETTNTANDMSYGK